MMKTSRRKRKKIRPTHPGKILLRGIHEHGLTPYRVAVETGISQSTMSAIVNERRSISEETALRLSLYFKTSPEYWLNLQNDYAIRMIKLKKGAAIKKAVRPFASGVV